ncbi:MAG: hypothetical protein MUF54_12745 [Polyangiaceae bacterium]|nr:hypothetical protein [Polyangiaceae bacterium]
MNIACIAPTRTWVMAFTSVVALGACTVVTNPNTPSTPLRHHHDRAHHSPPPAPERTAPAATATPRTPAQPRPGVHDEAGTDSAGRGTAKPRIVRPESTKPWPMTPHVTRPPSQPAPTGPARPGLVRVDGSTRLGLRRVDGAPCSQHVQCASGTCEGMGCGENAGRCVPTRRMCTRDLREYCGCDGVTFGASGSCPMKTYRHRGPCSVRR